MRLTHAALQVAFCLIEEVAASLEAVARCDQVEGNEPKFEQARCGQSEVYGVAQKTRLIHVDMRCPLLFLNK